MLSCDQCKAYKVEGQVECAICGFDPTRPPEPEPEIEDSSEDLVAEQRRQIEAASKGTSGATPFAILGIIAVGVVGFLILSGSNVFGTASIEDQDAVPGALANVDEAELGSWNNDGNGPVGSGDEALIEAMERACVAEGFGLEGVSEYRPVPGAHPVVIVDLRFGEEFTGADNTLQRTVVPRQATPDPLTETEFLLCATDSTDPGITEIECQMSDVPDSAAPKVPFELPGKDTDYRLIVAATGEVVWSHSKVFSEDLVDECDSPSHAINWARNRVEFPEPAVWRGVSEWVIGRGPDN